MLKLSSILCGSIVVLLAILLVSCQRSPIPDKGKKKETLVVPAFHQPAPINPILTDTTISANLADILFDGLIRLDDQFLATPHLAESWERSPDGKTWTFHLRQGIKFHDGKVLTAEDVVFTFEQMIRLQKGMRFASVTKEILGVEVKDSRTVQIHMKRPLASFVKAFSVGVLPQHIWSGRDLREATPDQPPIGTGSYKLQSWNKEEIVLEANEGYFLGRPKIDKIRVIVYPSREAAWAKLIAGEADFFHYLTPENYEVLEQIPQITRYSVPMPYYYILGFNLSDTRFKDGRVRRALNYAVNKEKIVSQVLKDQGRVSGGTIFPESRDFNSDVRPFPYDPPKALELLKEAGWEDHDGDHFLDKKGKPFEFTVHVNSGDSVKEKSLLLVQQDLLDLGIRLKISPFDAVSMDFLFERRFEALFPEIEARPDTDSDYKFWHSSQIENGFNVFSYSNPEVDRLLDEARTTFDPEERKALYFAYQEEMLKDPPGIFLFWTNYLVGVHKRFKGVKISPLGPFANIREWYVSEDEP